MIHIFCLHRLLLIVIYMVALRHQKHHKHPYKLIIGPLIMIIYRSDENSHLHKHVFLSFCFLSMLTRQGFRFALGLLKVKADMWASLHLAISVAVSMLLITLILFFLTSYVKAHISHFQVDGLVENFQITQSFKKCCKIDMCKCNSM